MSRLAHDGELAENLLLHLDETARLAILDRDLSGQKRVNQLFRYVHRRIVRREVVLTVAQQDDGPKRVRDARRQLRREGIVVLGHQKSHPRIADAFELQTPPKGSWVAVRVVPAEYAAGGVAEIDGSLWRPATPEDPVVAGPVAYQ